MRVHPFPAVVAALISGAATSASASTNSFHGDFWAKGGDLLLRTSLYTRHYRDDPRHNNHQRMANIEWIADAHYSPSWANLRFAHSEQTRWLVGGAAFRNSFGQDSTYVYGGFRRQLAASELSSLYLKLTAGLLHGYRGEFRDKIPLNRLGVAPAVVPAIGLDHRRANIELIPFGTAGLMLNIGIQIR